MNHQPVEHSAWEKELREAALAVCDLYPGRRSGGADPRLDFWLQRLRAVAWKRDQVTDFVAEPTEPPPEERV